MPKFFINHTYKTNHFLAEIPTLFSHKSSLNHQIISFSRNNISYIPDYQDNKILKKVKKDIVNKEIVF